MGLFKLVPNSFQETPRTAPIILGFFDDVYSQVND